MEGKDGCIMAALLITMQATKGMENLALKTLTTLNTSRVTHALPVELALRLALPTETKQNQA